MTQKFVISVRDLVAMEAIYSVCVREGANSLLVAGSGHRQMDEFVFESLPAGVCLPSLPPAVHRRRN